MIAGKRLCSLETNSRGRSRHKSVIPSCHYCSTARPDCQAAPRVFFFYAAPSAPARTNACAGAKTGQTQRRAGLQFTIPESGKSLLRVSADKRPTTQKTAFPSMWESRFDVPFLKRGGGLCPCELASLRAYALRRLSINPIAANGHISPRRHSGTDGDPPDSDLWSGGSCDRTIAPTRTNVQTRAAPKRRGVGFQRAKRSGVQGIIPCLRAWLRRDR